MRFSLKEFRLKPSCLDYNLGLKPEAIHKTFKPAAEAGGNTKKRG